MKGGSKMNCTACGQPIKEGEHCYQVRYGAIEEDGETFLPEEDITYFHKQCVTDGVNY